jgi:hypothetical protein
LVVRRGSGERVEREWRGSGEGVEREWRESGERVEREVISTAPPLPLHTPPLPSPPPTHLITVQRKVVRGITIHSLYLITVQRKVVSGITALAA